MRGCGTQSSGTEGVSCPPNAKVEVEILIEMNPKKVFSKCEQPGVRFILREMGEYVGNVLLFHVRTWQNYPEKLNQRNNLSKNEPADHCHTKSTERGIQELFTSLI